jgi:hypothetical protein
MKTRDELIIEYFRENRPPLGLIKDIQVIRDGGTVQIYLRSGKMFYIKGNVFHDDYPTCNDNIISDELLTACLMNIINNYISNREQEIYFLRSLFNSLTKLYP